MRYPVSAEEEAALVARQGGRCAICSEKKELVVDRDCRTGDVRKALCSSCNQRVGVLEGPWCARGIEYLRRRRASPERLAELERIRHEDDYLKRLRAYPKTISR